MPVPIVIVVKLLHPSKAEFSKDVTLFGIITDDNPVMPENAPAPIDKTPSGIVTVSILEQFLNAFIRISVTLLGIETADRLLHPPNKEYGIIVIEFGRTTEVSFLQSEKALNPILLIQLGIITEQISLDEKA